MNNNINNNNNNSNIKTILATRFLNFQHKADRFYRSNESSKWVKNGLDNSNNNNYSDAITKRSSSIKFIPSDLICKCILSASSYFSA